MESLAEKIPDRRMVVARELTKLFEQVRTGTVAEVADYFANHPDTVRGEFVIMVAGTH